MDKGERGVPRPHMGLYKVATIISANYRLIQQTISTCTGVLLSFSSVEKRTDCFHTDVNNVAVVFAACDAPC